jgi:hypothetical protein
MNQSRIAMRALALAGSLTLLAGSSAFAQGRNDRQQRNEQDNQAYSNRTVDGTVQSVTQDRNGERVRLTNGMDVFVPASVTATNSGRRYGAAMLQPGDVVRLNVYSRQGDGRDAEVRTMELLSTNATYNNDRRLKGTVVSFNRRHQTMVISADNGQTMNVDLSGYNRLTSTNMTTFRKGDRISLTGRIDRGVLIADDVRLRNNNNYNRR